WAAVHEEGDRIALPGVEAPGLHHIAVYGLIVPATKAELLVLAHVPLIEQALVHGSEPLRLAAVQRYGIQVRRRAKVAAAKHHALARCAEGLHGTDRGEPRRFSLAGVDAIQHALPELIHAGKQRPAIGRCTQV